MPVKFGRDKEGCYSKYGHNGHKYYYKCNSDIAKENAKKKAIAQGVAIGDFGPIKLIEKKEGILINLKSYTDYPQQVTENAKIALRWAEENGWGDCGTSVGKARANQLANREPISRDTIARMAAFERHRQNSDKELGDGCGRLMWQAWGGSAGVEWAQRKLKQIDNEVDLIKLKKWRGSPDSSNVNKIMYNDEIKELVIKFNSGDIYTYSNIEFDDFRNIIEGNAVCISSGENKWGSWDLGKYPSVGAAVHKYLIDTGATYRKGGTLR